MRVVLDTNILARSSYRLEGPAAEVLDRVTAPPHILVLSESILAELARVLAYPRLRALHKLSDEKIAAYIAKLQTQALVLNPSESQQHVINDPGDIPILAAAVAGQADAICTLDRDFHDSKVQEYCRQRKIEIVDDVQLLARLRQLDSQNDT